MRFRVTLTSRIWVIFLKRDHFYSYFLGDPANILLGNGESTVDGSLNGSTATLKRGQIQPAATNGKAIGRKPSLHHKIFGGPGHSNGKVRV